MIGFRHVMMSVGKLFTQLLSSLNLVDGVPNGMVDKIDDNNTLYKNANAWAYVATSYFSITGLLTTDTVEVFGISAVPTIPADGQLHIASGEVAYGVRIKRSGIEWAYYSFSEYIEVPSTHIAYDVSGNDNHATLVNGSTANRGSQSEFFYGQLGINYRAYVLNRSDYSEVGFFPSDSQERFDITFYCRDEYAQSSYLIDSRGQVNWLGYIYATSGGTLSLSMSRDDILVDGISSLTFPRDTNYHRVEIKGVRFFTTNEVVLRLFGHNQSGTINESFNRIANFEMRSQLTGATIFIFQNSIDNLTSFNQIVREGLFIPALASDLTKDALGNTITLTQDGFMWLNDGSTMEQPDIQVLKDADIYNVWFDGGGNPKQVTFSELETAIATYPDVYGGNVVSGKSIKNISLK